MDKSAAAGLQNNLEALGTAIEGARLAMALTDAAHGKNPIIFANGCFCSLTALSPDAVLGRPLAEILAALSDHPTLAGLTEALSAGVAGRWGILIRNADCQEVHLTIIISPVCNTDGAAHQNLVTIVETGMDSSLTPHSSELHAAYENAPGFIATTSGSDHRFTFANASYKKFVGRECIEGMTVAAALPEIVEQGVIALLDEVYRSGKSFLGTDMPIMIADRDGVVQSRYIDVIYQPVRDDRNEICGLFCEGYDVTAKHVAKEALAALQTQMLHVSRVNAMGTMASTLAHELNQPLSAIGNYLAGVNSDDHTAENLSRIVEALDGIGEAAQRAAGIIQNLRDLTRQREPKRTSFSLKSAVNDSLKLITPSTSPGNPVCGSGA